MRAGRRHSVYVPSSSPLRPISDRLVELGQIGVSYFGDRRSELRSSADNARAVQRFLLRASHSVSTHPVLAVVTYCITTPCWCHIGHGYRNEDIRVLAEDDYDPRRHPTKVNIIDALHWLVKGAQPGDHLFFHCTCHSRSMCALAFSRCSSRDRFGTCGADQRDGQGRG